MKTQNIAFFYNFKHKMGTPVFTSNFVNIDNFTNIALGSIE